jgi:hypothetical protein
MLPEVISYDPSRPAIFPHNGRTLTDDSADAFLAVLTNGKVTGDEVGPHGDLLAEFLSWGHHITADNHIALSDSGGALTPDKSASLPRLVGHCWRVCRYERHPSVFCNTITL